MNGRRHFRSLRTDPGDGGLSRLLRPASIAFVGASESPVKVGGRRWLTQVAAGFSGPIHPVNPVRDTVAGVPAYKTLADVPGPIDLVVVAVPPPAVSAVIDECVTKQVGAVVVIAGGFGEHSTEGRHLELSFAERLKTVGARMVGPNCAGIFAAPAAVNVTGMQIPGGPIGLVTQSGNILLDLAHRARTSGIGFSYAISTGNGVDVRPPELLRFLIDDGETKAIIVYVEGWLEGEAREFCDIARAVRGSKPVIVVKPGETEAGRRAVMSHTGSLAGEMRVADGAFEQAGIIKAVSIDEAWQLAQALCLAPAMPSNRVVVASDGGGHATLACDSISLAGLELATLTADTQNALKAFLPDRCPVANPVDYAGYAEEDPAAVARSIEVCLAAPEVGGALLAGHFGGYHRLAGAGIRDAELEAARRIGTIAADFGKPVVVHSVYAHDDEEAVGVLRRGGVPVVRSLPEAAALLSGMRRFAEAGAYAEPRGAPGENRPAIAHVLARAGADGLLLEPDARELLALYGLPVEPGAVASNAAQCSVLVSEIGMPAALKIVSASIVHKSEHGGVILGVGPAEAADAFERLAAVGRAAGDPEARVLVSPMIARGVELVAGGFRDANFGPVVMLGMGGVLVEVLEDVVFRLAPLSEEEALAMIGRMRSQKLLDGFRGAAGVDRQSLARAVARLSRLMADAPAVREVDVNPLISNADGLHVVDARVVIDPAKLHDQPLAVIAG